MKRNSFTYENFLEIHFDLILNKMMTIFYAISRESLGSIKVIWYKKGILKNVKLNYCSI